MSQLWTIIFFAVLAAAFGLASWHDWDDRKARERRASVAESGGGDGRAGKRGGV
jgi:hypothetical protein